MLRVVLICRLATCHIAAGTCCDTVRIWEQKSPATRNITSLYRPHACEARRRFVLICRSSIAGSSGGCVAGTSAAYENQALNSRIHLFIYRPALPLTSLSLTIVVHHSNRCHPIRSRNEMLKCKPGYNRNRALEYTSLQGRCQDSYKERGQWYRTNLAS